MKLALPALGLLAVGHDRLVHGRRVRVLADAIAPLLDPGWRVLDVGCGDGRLAALLAARNPSLTIEGADVQVRGVTAVPVRRFDGRHLPWPDQSVDAVLLIDVLHHTEDPAALLGEARRVARCAVILKDHRVARPLARTTLRFMDWVGNRPHHVVLPYSYWTEAQWRLVWGQLGVHVDHYQTRLGLYPWPVRWLFDAGLHFLARLVPEPGLMCTKTVPADPTAWEEAYVRFATPQQEIRKFVRRLRALGAHQWDRGLRVAELFCGRGNGVEAWRQLGFERVEGLDLSAELVRQYRGSARIRVGDARELPFDDGSCDVVCVQGGLHHLNNMQDVRRVLKEIQRVLRPAGRLVVIEPWLTPFLRLVHAACRLRVLRRISRRLEALATMIELERATYDAWLSAPKEILDAFRAVGEPTIVRIGWGKLMLVARVGQRRAIG